MNKILQISRPVQRIPHARIHPPARFSRPDGGNPGRLRPTDGIERIPEGGARPTWEDRHRLVGAVPVPACAEIEDQRSVPRDRLPAGSRGASRSVGRPRRSGERRPPPLPGGHLPRQVRGHIALRFPRTPEARADSRDAVAIAVARSIARISPGSFRIRSVATRSGTGTKQSVRPGRPPGRNPRRDGGTRNLPCAPGVLGSVGRRRPGVGGHHHVRSADLRSACSVYLPSVNRTAPPAETTRAALLPVKPVR